LGPIIDAVKILVDLQVKPLIDERQISYSGEMILEKIANTINLSKVLEKHAGDDRVAEIYGELIDGLVYGKTVQSACLLQSGSH
jgi:hypothetical protein